MRKILSGLYLSVAAVSLTWSVKPALAQSSGGIEEVTVTAERREEQLSKVPISVTAFTAQRLDQLNAKNFGDLVAYTPGVDFNDSTNSISIRGVNSTAGDATTGIYIDDTPIQLRTLGFGSDNALPDVFDLERVEVLRGPQGTLFGAGSEGGTVRFITPKASLTDYQVYAKSELSFTQSGAPSYEGGAAVGGPIVDDKLGFRISAWWRHDGGWIDHVDPYTGNMIEKNANHTNTLVLHGAVTWQVTNDLSITPSVFYQNRDVHNDDEYWVALSNPGSDRYINETPERMANKDHFTLPALKVDWNFGGAELISNTSYFDRKQIVQDYSGTLYNLSYFQQSESTGVLPIDYTTPCTGGLCATAPQPLLTATGINLPGFGPYKSVNYVTNTQQNFTQEARLQSTDPNSRFTWVLGGFYTHQSQLSVEEINDPQLPALTSYLWGDPGPGAACYDPPTGNALLDVWCGPLLANGDDYINHTQGHERQLAGFANVTYEIVSGLKIQAGARIAKTHFDYKNYADGSQDFGPNTPNSGKQNETPFTPMGNITWQINDDDMIYATVSKGYRIGGANAQFPLGACTELSAAPGAYNSDTVVNYEAGSKDKFFDNRLQMSGSVYYLKWNNIQQLNYLPSCGFEYTANVGSAQSKGFDLEGEWLPIDALDIDFSLGYTDAQFTSTSISGGQLLASKGDKLPGSPWTFSLGAQYNASFFGRDAFLRMDYEYQSKTATDVVTHDPLASSYDPALMANPEKNIFTLRAGATFGNVNLTLFADNLFNAHPQLDLSHQDSDTVLFEATALRPRTIGITATYRN
ncbi:MAG TPA: TonB-dependent receptor [Rhizomicrobium sp.]|jgi:outer membrane receptor protein involved in Fe transport